MFSLNCATLNAQHGSHHNTPPLTLHTGAVGVFASKFTTYGNTTFTSNTAVGDGGRNNYEVLGRRSCCIPICGAFEVYRGWALGVISANCI